MEETIMADCKVLYLNLPEWAENNHEKSQSGESNSELKIKPRTSQIRRRSTEHSVIPFSVLISMSKSLS